MADQLFSLRDQVVFVSGGSRGIGRALAVGFAERQARVIVTGRDQTALAETQKLLDEFGDGHQTRECDVSNPDDIATTVSSVIADFGQIDTLLNVAGVNRRQRAETYTTEDYNFILDINLRGAFLMARDVGRHMLQQGHGCIVNIDSLNTYAPLKGVLPYAMSKGGLSMMTRGLALEWGPRGVRVNGLAPGFILTDLTRKLWSDPTMQNWACTNTPLQRLGETEDLIGAAVFLSSPAAAFMTGQTIYVDGGMSAGMNWPIPLPPLGE